MYGLGVCARNTLYDRGAARIHSLRGAVVSVGNLSVGGSGKTPFILLLGGFLKAREIPFDILSRGYGRATQGVALVDPNGKPREFGDEPLLLARKLEMPVIVGESRYQAGLFSEEIFGPRLHLLDDGFQHRSLARDLDIVLVGPNDAKDSLFPIGRLREPLSSLRRADVIVLTNKTDAGAFASFKKSIWHVHRALVIQDAPARPVVFCGIARPHDFVQQLRDRGIIPAVQKFYRDHRRYTSADVKELKQLRMKCGADGFITTEKDAINLTNLRHDLSPIAIASVSMAMDKADAAMNTILATLEQRGPRP